MSNPNPKNKFQKGDKRAGRPPGGVREHIRAARDAGGRNWCPIFYSAEARRTRSQFIGDSRVTGNGLPSSLKRGRTVVNIDVLYVVSIWLLPVLIAVTFHEAAHGYVARFLGDDTASRLGRVSLNPFRHIDPFGTILLPGLLLLARSPFLFGYAKPVPINFSMAASRTRPRHASYWDRARGTTPRLIPRATLGGHSRVRRETLGVNPTTFGIRRDSRN
jgi:hypothetical protein